MNHSRDAFVQLSDTGGTSVNAARLPPLARRAGMTRLRHLQCLLEPKFPEGGTGSRQSFR